MSAVLENDSPTIDLVAPDAGFTSGQVVQLPDGRAGVIQGLRGASAGDPVDAIPHGKFVVPKTADVVFLDGQGLWWDRSAGKANFRRNNDGDFYLGTCVGDAASADTTCVVHLNVKAEYVIVFGNGAWTSEATNGLGVTVLPGGGAKLEFDAVAEVAQAAIYSADSVAVDAKPILEAWLAIHNVGDAAALDIDIGLASGSHSTDFETIANFVAIHFDGSALDVKVHSDDGTTDVSAVDSLLDAVDDTRFFLQIDARNPANVRIYVNGVNAVPSGTTLTLAAASNALVPIVHMEKTSDDTVADVRVFDLRVRTST